MRLAYTGDDRFVYPSHWTVGAHLGVRSADDHWRVEIFGRNLGNEHEPATLFGGPAFVPDPAGVGRSGLEGESPGGLEHPPGDRLPPHQCSCPLVE